MKDYIKEYKNYSIQKLGNYLVAVPRGAHWYAHKMMVCESNEFAFKEMVKLLEVSKTK